MLELLYHKRNHLITTVVDDNIFKKIFPTITWEKNLRRYYFCLSINYNGKIIINT